jgi:hypothetical protein
MEHPAPAIRVLDKESQVIHPIQVSIFAARSSDPTTYG